MAIGLFVDTGVFEAIDILLPSALCCNRDFVAIGILLTSVFPLYRHFVTVGVFFAIGVSFVIGAVVISRGPVILMRFT